MAINPDSLEIATSTNWVDVCDLDDLQIHGRKVVRVEGKQIALFHEPTGIFACNNRCPHEGYPLSEGDVDNSCILTCNWHNWKFDLSDGRNLFGDDDVRVYATRIEDKRVWLDLTEPPLEERIYEAFKSLRGAMRNNNFTRLARELARLTQLGVGGPEIIARAIEWSYCRMEYGWTHAFAGAADWLTLYQENEVDQERKVTCLLEAVGHMADDTLRQPEFPYPSRTESYDQTKFLNAIENEDEDVAVTQIAGATRGGLRFEDLEFAFSKAALAHYNDFGHSLIYVTKARQLLDAVGSEANSALLLSLTRRLIYARREDLIPRFRHYSNVVDNWQENTTAECPVHEDFRTLSIDRAMDRVCAASSENPEKLFDVLLAANASHMLHFDIALQSKHDNQVEDNVGWLDFTHSLTFANAVRRQCQRYPDLWKAGLLQMACFSGRNHLYTDYEQDLHQWYVDDVPRFFKESKNLLYDHGQQEFIVSVHLLKTTLAVEEEAANASDETRRLLVAALNRFLHSPLQRKHLTRTVRQAMNLIALDG